MTLYALCNHKVLIVHEYTNLEGETITSTEIVSL